MNLKQMQKSLNIFSIYIKEEDHFFHAEHDILWGPHSDIYEKFAEEDKIALMNLGWFIDDENQSLMHYCSC